MNLNQAKQKINRFKESFAEQYGEGHYIFACHAAFPIGFTPDMLYQIWANFREYPVEGGAEGKTAEVDLIAISDLLLSPLCNKTGRNLYEMDVKIRAVLLDELRSERFAAINRMEELAYFIFQYLDSIVAQFEYESFRETLYWNTLVTISPQQAFQEVTQKLGEYIRENNEGEIMRMRNLLESFAYQDLGVEQMGNSSFGKLLSYTKALKASILDYPASVINQQIRESGAIAFTSDPSVAEGSIEIPLLEDMMGKVDLEEANLGDFEMPPEPTKEVFALTIGIDEYIYPSMRLNGCINDVNLVTSYLKETLNEDHDYDLVLTSLTNEKATAENIRNTLAQFREEAGPEDIVFFFFAGHSVKDRMGLDYTSLILHDTRIEWEKEQATQIEEFKLEPLLAEGWACDIVLVIDTHYAAAVLQQHYPHIIFFAGCGADQQSFEHRIGNRTNGMFTFNVIKALRDHKQRLTYQQLFQEVRLHMQDSGYDQSPVLLASQQQMYKYFLGEYAPKSEDLMNRIEAARSKHALDLDLAGLDLSFIPPEVFELTSLEWLDLSNNQIDGIPTKLMKLNNLHELDLRNNLISRLNMDVLSMPSLKTVFLSGNPIPDIPAEILDGEPARLKAFLANLKKDARNLFTLFIGIDEYPNIQKLGTAHFRGAVSDARAIRQALKNRYQTSPKFNLQLRDLYNEEATKNAIVNAIYDIINQSKENDVFLCYFAGSDEISNTSGEPLWVTANSTFSLDGQEEISSGELVRLIQPLLEKHVNTILLNPPKWNGQEHESLVVVDPGVFNNEGSMADGSYHSHFAFELLQRLNKKEEVIRYEDLQTMGQKTPSYSRVRTRSKNLPVLKTPKLNFDKVFLESELGYGQQFRQRIQEAQSSSVLNLSGMNLDHIPPQVYDIHHLAVLDLAGNQIDFLPEQITELKALERLELEGNPILNLPQSFLIEGSVQDIRNYFSALKEDREQSDLPVIISLFFEINDILEQLPNAINEVLTPYQEQKLLINESLVNPTSDEVFRLFYRYRENEIALFNISANTDRNIIQVLDPRGESISMPVDACRKITGYHRKIKMVLMDGSDSSHLAAKMLDWGIPAAIGIEGQSTNDKVVAFWKTFYQSLNQGKSLREAYEAVKDSLNPKEYQQSTR